MQLDPPLAVGRLVKRYKRFLADIETPSGMLTVHCPNTGAMLGCADPGSEAWYSRSDNPKRKYPHTLEVVRTSTGLVGVNSARANDLVAEALGEDRVPELAGYAEVRREVAIPGERGRFDFMLSGATGTCYLEVKSLTLGLADGRGAFPDAVSERAVRHVQALAHRVAEGDRAVLLFCVQHTGVRETTTADDIHPDYGAAVRAALDAGLEVFAYGCDIQRDQLRLADRLPFTANPA